MINFYDSADDAVATARQDAIDNGRELSCLGARSRNGRWAAIMGSFPKDVDPGDWTIVYENEQETLASPDRRIAAALEKCWDEEWDG